MNIYSFNYLQANLEDMKQSFELSIISLLNLKDVYSMFNRTDDPKVQLNDNILLRCGTTNTYFIKIFQKSKKALMETLKYIFFMSSHTFPAIFYGILKEVNGKICSVSTYNEMMGIRTRLRKQFEVELIYRIF